MSKLEVDAIEPQSGTTITIGASGDTLTVPSGATLNVVGTLVQSGDSGFTGAVTITTTDNSDTLTLKSTDADANVGPNLILQRDSGSPADGDSIGRIDFDADNDAGQVTSFFSIRSEIEDASDGTEDGQLKIDQIIAGTTATILRFKSTETVFNDDSKDVDFRVESNGNANMLFVDGGNDRVGIGTSSPNAKLDVTATTNNEDLIKLSHPSSPGNADGILGFNSDGTTDNNVVTFGVKYSSVSYDVLNIKRSTQFVGIGTTNPQEELDISSTSPRIRFSDTSVANLRHVIASEANDLEIRCDDGNVEASSHIGFKIDGSEKVRISDAGNVGIGISNPSTPLHIVTTDGGNVDESLTITNASTTAGTGARIRLVNSTDTASTANSVSISSVRNAGSNHDLLFESSNNERMRILSDGKVGIGTSSPGTKLEVVGTGVNGIELGKQSDGNDSSRLFFTNNDNVCVIRSTGGNLVFSTTATINSSSGDDRVYVGRNNGFGVGSTPDGSVAQVGIELGYDGYILNTRNNDVPMFVNRLGNDGTVISIRQDTVQEGGIDVSGGTVTYNGFTGTHWSRFTDNSTPTILRGTVLESLDEMCDWYNLHFDTTNEQGKTISQVIPHVLEDGQSDGDTVTYNHEGTDYQATIVKEDDVKHMMSKVSDTTDAKNVYGVFSAYDLDGEGYNDFYVASVGTYVVRIKQGETIAKGDLLQSNGDGTAKVQTDDAVRSSSFAKVLSTTIIETYEDGSYLVPCSLMC